MERNKSYDIADHKRELYDALVKSYQIDKYLFDSYGEVFSLKRSRDDRDKDRDPFTGSDRGMKRRKSSKYVVSSIDSRSSRTPNIPKDYFINNDLEYLKGEDLSRRYSISMTKTKAATYELKWIKDLVPKLWSPVQLKYDQHAYLEEESLRRVEDLQLDVKSYQKKLNLTKPDTYRLNLRNKTAYTSYSDPHGIIYVDQYKRKRLMHADELHKFSDGTLNDVRSALHDIAAGIRMEYLPIRKWSNLDKKRGRVMVQDIDKQLYQRRLMRNLEKFVGGREYENDLRLLERTI
ncbi:hypothetical protein Tco_1106251 [Tanacetum coccineum]